MNIVEIIAEELPNSCSECVFSEWWDKRQYWMCDCFGDKNTILKDSRPDYCPLKTGTNLVTVEDWAQWEKLLLEHLQNLNLSKGQYRLLSWNF